jgi:hypothetical protein
MTASLNDPLLVLARGLTHVLFAVVALLALGFAICLPLAIAAPETVVSILVEQDVDAIPPGTAAMLAGLCGVGLASLVAAGYFLMLQLGIIGSVAAGDPFAPANADRLARMGWTVLAIQVLAVPLGLLEYRLQELLDPDDAIITLSFFDNGLVLALVLFVLARVFRHGAAMREDLEGTV